MGCVQIRCPYPLLQVTVTYRIPSQMKRTQTADSVGVKYSAAKGTVTFGATESPAPGLPTFQTRFHFDPGAKFDSFLHFHASHAEYLYCEQGQIRVQIGDMVKIVGPEDGQLEIPAWTPHRWVTLGVDQETIVWERTDPNDGQKELFFRNLFSLVNDYGGMPPFLQMFKVFSDYDNYPIGTAWWQLALRSPIVWLTDAISLVATVVGYASVYKEYTPKHLLRG
ncbi:hypothetical protein DAEQUDRAFT_733330 [Daedalea quercina L-15889]|uniref:Cupin type-2 domain-containing protein n=1 Tax=Daedalea quercina L-15889 TaxID=1314783 RepID=A0A165L367_9APHY|nr:hypothetical protein DAEQUDRAFT_733330 [Daedalea quercina L-15889]